MFSSSKARASAIRRAPKVRQEHELVVGPGVRDTQREGLTRQKELGLSRHALGKGFT